MKKPLLKTKSGAAAFYVVIFTTLLLSVVVLSFVRLMVSEATKTTNDDLSKSAYDSALAGVEDAKIALVKYHQCLDQGYTANSTAENGSCAKIVWAMQNGAATGDCDVISKILGRNNYNGGEVIVQEGQTALNSSDSNSVQMDQAYTCVKITEDLDVYRSTLTSANRVRLIPIRAADVNKITGIAFNWYNGDRNMTTDKDEAFESDSNKLPTRDKYNSNNYIPFVSFDLYQTDSAFSLGQLSVNNGDSGTDHVSLFLRPVKTVTTAGKYSASDLLNASDKANNSPLSVYCGDEVGTEKCHAMFQLPNAYSGSERSTTTALLRVELPYGDVSTDFSIQLCTGTSYETLCDTTTNFVGVQAQIDATGRANDVYRRVDSRVELIDTNFPYPEFAVQLTGDSNETISKNFWVTNYCWKSSAGNGVETCENTGS